MKKKLVKAYDLKQGKLFLKSCVGHRFECFYKLIMTYQISKFELLNLEWTDIDFYKNTIRVCPIKYTEYKNKTRSYAPMVKVEGLARAFPLLPHLKNLLLIERQKQLEKSRKNKNYDFDFNNYVCIKPNGKRLNSNTLSRNIKYITRDNNLPETLISSIKKSLDDFICKRARNYDYYRAWTQFDIYSRRENIYKNLNLNKNKSFLNALNSLIENQELDSSQNFEM